MLCLKHRTASGSLDELWEYDPARRALDIVCRQGARTFAFRVSVCSPERPRLGAHALVRVSEGAWRLLPLAFYVAWEGLEPRDRAIQPWLTPGDQILLTCAPPQIDSELEELATA